VIAAWSTRDLPIREPARTERELVAENRVATFTGATGFLTEVRVRGHGLIADEPAAVGGTDAGPTPYDLLLAALGTCTGMTLRMYADRKGWPVEDIRVALLHEKIHARDEARPEESDARLDSIQRELSIDGQLTPEQLTRLLEIADRCPVHRTLDAGVRITTSLAESPEEERGEPTG
jgi:putative redox protein